MPTNKTVDDYFKELDHPMKEEIMRVREIILATDERITEDIKWKAPTFIYKGNIASYFMNAKKFVSLMFHKGATMDDKTGLLEGDGKEARVARFEDMKDIEKKKKKLEKVIKTWIKMQS